MTMTYRQLGPSGLTVSAVGIGCNAFGARIDEDRTREVVDAAVDVGITLFDTADIYGYGASEELLGRALGTRRDEVVIATKFGMDMQGANGEDWGVRGSRRYIRRAVDASLRRLGTDRIDLYQMHEPDPRTPIEETLAALDDLVTAGKVHYVGSSNFASWQVVDADWVAKTDSMTAFITAQNKYSVYDRSADDELVPACEHLGLSLLPFVPLEYGLLTGKYRRGASAPAGSRLEVQAARLENADFDRIEAIEDFAAECGVSVLDVAIGGLLALPVIGSVISGATSAEQVRTNAAAGEWVPSDAEVAALDELTRDFGD
jgi:aryl-alcohol dehydrogenase-like predicted oxidoreductase